MSDSATVEEQKRQQPSDTLAPNQTATTQDQPIAQQQVPTDLVDYLFEMAQKIQENIDKKYEPIEQLRELNQLLNTKFQEIWLTIGESQGAQARKVDFYKKVFKSTVDKMLAEKLLSQPGYLPQILRFFRNILVNFFPNDIKEESLAEIVHSLFNLEAPLYTTALQSTYRKQMNQDQSFNGQQDEDEMSLDQRRIKAEYEWRQNLKEGDRVDCINYRIVQTSKISHWTPGVITQTLDNDQFYVACDNEQVFQNKIVNRYGPDIAYPGTFTDDFDWRYSLKEGDIFDCLDSEGVWYKSTCLQTRSTHSPDQTREQKEILVGFRIYDEEEGHKVDDDGRKYIGWSNRYDEWMPITSPTVQRLNTMVKYYKIAGKATMIYDNVVDDLIDVITNTKERKIWAVYRNNFFSNLKCIPDYLNEFGSRGGFEKILMFMDGISHHKITMRHLYYLMDFLSKTQPLWHRLFSCDYIPRMKLSFEKALTFTNPQMTGPIQLKFTKESISGIQKSFQNVLRRFYTTDYYTSLMAELLFSIGFTLMKSDKLESRIQGIKEIVEQIKGTKFSMRKTLNAHEVIKKLKDENIFEMIFGDDYHIQLIQRSQEIIKFYINEKQITEKEIDYIWQATKKDQQTKMEIYKIISEIAIMFRNDEIELLVERFAQVPPEQFVEKEIECVYELSKYSYKQANFSVRAAQLFWDIAVQERPYKKQIVEMAMDKFIELIRNWEREQKGEYIYNSIEKIQSHKSSIQCIKIMQKILDQIPSYRVNSQPTIFEVANQLIKDANLINLVIEDLIYYEDIANTLWTKGTLNEENIEQQEVLDLPFSHRNHVFVRLNFIRQLLQQSQTYIEIDQLDKIWDILMVKTKISIDSDIFFNWFKQLLNDHNKLSQELIQHFFETKVCKDDVSFKNIRKAGFDCICNIFLQINEQEDKIMVLSLPNINNQNSKLDFRLHVPPNELTGIHLIWKLLQECDKKNLDLTAVVIDLVTKVYHNLSSTIENQIHSIEDQFCHESISRLEAVLLNAEATDEEKTQFTHIITIMMKSFFDDSERNGTGMMKTHQAIADKGFFIERLVIQNNITSQKNTPKFIEVNTYQNMTIWELKKIIADKTKQSPLRIQLQRNDQKKKQILDTDNQKMLKEFRFENLELVFAQKKPLLYTPRVPLLSKKRELMPEARAIFESWFDKFSTPEGLMTPETCVEFIRSSTSDQTVMSTDQRIVRLFNEYDKDIDGRITKDEFIEFYRDRAQQKPELVWSNLNSHGIGNDLRPLSNQYLQDDPQEIKDASILPRYKLSNNLDQLNELFKLLKHAPTVGKPATPSAQDELWNFITSLRTNPLVYSKLLTLSDIEDFTHPNNTIHQLLYNLQILESFINEYQTRKQMEIRCYYTESQEYNQQFPSLIGEQSNDNNEREVQNAAPESGKAIPLPPSNASIINNVNSNIPEPPTQYPIIGPVPPPSNSQANAGQEQQKVKDMLDNFKGQVIIESLSDEQFNSADLELYIGDLSQDIGQIKKSWISNFVNVGGFNILQNLLKILNDSINLKFNNALAASEENKAAEAFQIITKVEKECLNQILKLMKILLMASFISNSASSELNLELSRKLSSKDQVVQIQEEEQPKVANTEEKKDQQQPASSNEAKSQIKSDQEDTAKLYEPLIQVLQGDLGSQIVGSIEFKSFQEQILSIVQFYLKKEKKIGGDDKMIIDQGINLWIACVVFNADLLQYIYDDHIKGGDLESGTNKTTTKILIEDGLLCEHIPVRLSFKSALQFICQSVKSQSLSEQPYQFFLKVLLSEISVVDYKSQCSKHYFQVLKFLLNQYFEAKKINHLSFKEVFDHKLLLLEFINKLFNYQSREKKSTFLEDQNLVGYLDILLELIKNSPEILTKEQYNEILVELIEKCLFSFQVQPLNTHITKDTDIVSYEKPFINKCQSMEARSSAFALLTTICTINPEMVGEIIAKYWHPLLFKVKKPKKSSYAPRSEGRSFYGFCGIKNLGCICYMNAMIQQFFHIPTFRYSLLAADDRQPPSWNDFEEEKVDDNMLHQLMKLMGFLELSERQDYNPREFCFSFKDFAGQPTNVRIQQDSQEFLNIAFDRLESLLASTSQKYLLQNVFGGKNCIVRICKSCGNINQRNEDFYNLSLEVKNQKSIYDGLKKYISGEIINDFQCEACNQRVDVERKTVLESLPNMLIVHLQRIVYDFDSLSNQKLNSRVEFPNILNLKPYMYSEVIKQEKELLKKAKKEKKKQEQKQQKKEEEIQRQQSAKMEDGKQEEEGLDQQQVNAADPEAKMKEPEEAVQAAEESFSDEDEEDKENEEMHEELPEEDFQYKLVGVILHMGTADAGHYISYININRGHKSEESPEWLQTEKEKWLEFNDSNVKDYKFSNLEEDCFGGAQSTIQTSSDYKNDYSRNAYMLIYEKRRKRPIKVVIPESLIQQQKQSQSQTSLDCDGTAISRGATQIQQQQQMVQSLEDIHLQYISPQIQEVLAKGQNLIFDEEKQEYYALLDFNQIQKFVPHPIYKQVHEDNHIFLCEKQIFNNSFFEVTKNLIQLLIDKVPQLLSEQEPFNEPLFQFMDRIIFDLLSMTSENKQLLELTKIYISMLDKNDTQTLKLVSERIMAAKEKLGKDQKTFLESLISNLEINVREMNQFLLTYAVNKLFELNNHEQLDVIMNQALALIPEDLSKNWLKIHQFLTFLFDVTRKGKDQLAYMINKKLATKLIDFFLENDSPLVAGNKKRQPMGSNYANPQLENLILTVSFIARQYKYIDLSNPTMMVEDTDVQQQQLPEPADQIEQQDEDIALFQKRSPFYMGCFQGALPKLSNEDIFMLSQKAFITKGMKSGYEQVEFSRLLSHLCYENYDYSVKVAKKMLVGINKANADEIELYLNPMLQVMWVQDSLRAQRIEWIFGIPQMKIEKPAVYQMASNHNQMKMGVSMIDAANDEICEYKSTLFKVSGTVKESFLQILYSYRKRWSKYSLSCITALLQSCSYDYNGQLLNYLKTMDPPTYTYARYIDWIAPFINEQIETCMRNSNIQSYQQELLLALRAKQLYDTLMSQQATLQLQQTVQQQVQKMPESVSSENKNQQMPEDKQDEAQNKQEDKIDNQQDQQQQQQQQDQAQQNQENQRSVIQYDAAKDGGPEQYLIWDIVSERTYKEIMLPENNIEIQVKELEVRISESRPDGQFNQVFPENLFHKSYNHGSYHNQVGSSQWGQKKMYGRGQNSAQWVTTRTEGGYQVSTARKVGQGGNRGGSSKKDRKRERRYQKKNPNQQQITQAARNDQDHSDGEYQHYDNDNDTQMLQEFQNDQHLNDSMEVEYQDDNNENSNMAEGGVHETSHNDQQNYDDSANERSQYQSQQIQGNMQDGEAQYDDVPQDVNQNWVGQHQQNQQPATNYRGGTVPQPISNNQEVQQQDNPYILPVQDSNEQVFYPQDQQEQAAAPQQEESANNQQQPQLDNQDTWEFNSWAVLMFTVINHEPNKAQKVTFSFMNTEPNGPPLNFKMPVTRVPFQIMGGREKDVLLFTKLRPFDESWGPFDFKVEVDQPKLVNNMINMGYSINTSDNQNYGNNNGNYTQGGYTGDSYGGAPYQDAMADEVSCPECTFLNSSLLTCCEICNAVLKR